VVRGVLPDQLRVVGLECLLVSTAHLVVQPGASVVRTLGGIHSFTGWDGPVIADSGGFQAFSLLAGNGLAEITERGLRFRFSPQQKFRTLTPASSIETQVRIGADIVYCLDYCTSPKAGRDEQERSVDLTLRWAKECCETFTRLVDRTVEPRPRLFAVVQGGPFADLRQRCADALAELGFDGFGFGGYPVLDGRLVDEVLSLADLVPGMPLHGLGIGTPENLVEAWKAGIGIFDCVLPTRNARRGVIYAHLADDPTVPGPCSKVLRLGDERWVRERGPLDPTCDCPTCARYSAGFVAHLFRIEDRSAATLASMHNLRFYARLIEKLRSASVAG
jgi:queuine tRNA-ribosyltransferase